MVTPFIAVTNSPTPRDPLPQRSMGHAVTVLLLPFCFFPQLVGFLPESSDLVLLCRNPLVFGRQLLGLCSRALPERGQLGHLVSLSLSQQAAFPFGVRDLLVGRLGVFLCIMQERPYVSPVWVALRRSRAVLAAQKESQCHGITFHCGAPGALPSAYRFSCGAYLPRQCPPRGP